MLIAHTLWWSAWLPAEYTGTGTNVNRHVCWWTPWAIRVCDSDCLSSGTIALFLEQMIQINREGRTKNFVGRRQVRKLSWRSEKTLVWRCLDCISVLAPVRLPSTAAPTATLSGVESWRTTGQLTPYLSVKFGPVNSHLYYRWRCILSRRKDGYISYMSSAYGQSNALSTFLYSQLPWQDRRWMTDAQSYLWKGNLKTNL